MLTGKPQLLFRRSGTLSIPICLETVTLALPFLGEIHLIARILLDGLIRTLCQRCRWDGDQEGKEDNESEQVPSSHSASRALKGVSTIVHNRGFSGSFERHCSLFPWFRCHFLGFSR